jgi:alkylation response protein AidB-like acyl-CoA dehydrogenase
MISFALSEDQQLIQETVRKFALEELRDRARELEKARGVPSSLRKKFAELGVATCDLPEAFGGMGLGTAVLVHEELAFGDPGAAVALWGPHLVPSALVELGDEAQAKRWLARLAGAEARGAVAWSEKGPSLPEVGFATTARREGAAWILEGDKAFVVNGDGADVVVVFAQIDAAAGWNGVGAFVVDGAKVTVGARHAWGGLETVSAASLGLRGVRVPDEDRLARGGGLSAIARFFARAQVMSAARQVGLARAGYEYALAYTQDRVAFGKPVAHFQSVAFDLAEMLMEVEAARWMVWRAAAELDAGNAEGVAVAAAAAVQANQGAWRVADDAVQLLGGAGFIRDYPVEKWLRDTKALAVLGQVDEVSRQVVAGTFAPALPAPWLQPVVT